MPVSFNSPARNLFLLGSSGADAVTNFFKTIDKSSSNPNEGQFLTSQIKYNYSDQKFLLSGTGLGNDSFGWIEKRDYDAETDPNNPTSTEEWGVRINPTVYSSALTLTTIELDSNNDIIVVGKHGGVNGDYGTEAPYVAKYSNAGVIKWSSTSYSGGVEYKNVTSDSNNEYYASGNTTTSNSVAFIEKFDVDGSPLWGKSAIVLGRDIELNGIAVNDRSQVVSVGWLEDDSRTKGYIVKVDTSNGTVLWDKTLVSSEKLGLVFTSTICEDVFIDTQDNIYVVGRLYNDNDSSTKSFIIKLSPEGNIVWQKETDENIEYYRVKADGATGQVVTFGRYYDSVGNDQGGLITKYTRGGNISWRRTIFSSFNGSDFFGSDTRNGGGIALDADASFYYVLYNDDDLSGQNPTAYTFGKVSTSGNGLGGFEYDDGESETVYYDILNATERIGRLSDGSVRNDTSDLITYPFNATRITFDDYATPVANKKRQMDDAGNFEYSGSPAIRPTDFQELNLLGDAGIAEFPVELITNDVLGPNLIINGDFEGDNIEGWFLDQNGGNVIDFYSSGYTGSRSLSLQNLGGSGNPDFYQSFTTTPGRTYRITLQQSGSPTFTIFDGSGVSGTTLLTMTTTNPTGSVAFEEEAYCTASSTTSTFAFASFGSGAYLMDDISVRETPILWGDQSGKGNSGTVIGATHNADGYWEFDGTDDKIIGPPCNTILSADSSIELWVNFDDVTTRQTIISGYDSTPSTDPNRWDFEMNAGTFRGGFHDNGFFTSSTSISIGAWNHVMLVLSSTNTLKFYLNGVLDKSQSCSGFNFGGPDINLSIGNRNESVVGPMDGKIGEVRIYPRALTPAQVFQNYNATKTKFIYEAPDRAPKIGPGLSAASSLLLNYDFGHRGTYDSAATVNVGENRYTSSFNLTKFSDGTANGVLTDWSWLGSTTPSITPYATTAPDGSKTATLITGASASIYQSIVNDSDFTISAWVKTVDGSSQSFQQSVYLLNTGGEILYTTHTATGDWQRFTFSGVATSEWGSPAGEYHRYTPFASTADLYVWGPQVELKSSANSYVPTYGTAAIPGVSRLPNTVKNLSRYPYSSYTGTLDGATFNSNGYMELDSRNSVINAGPANLYSGNNVSFEMWFYPETTAEADSRSIMLAANYEGGFTDGTVLLRYDQEPFGTARMFIAQVKIGSTDEFWQHSTQYPRDNWYHVVWTWNNGTMKLYINGSEKTLDTNTGGPTSGAILNGSGDIYIGENYTFGSTVIGDYGQFRIYTKTLSSTEVSKNFNATRGKYGV